MDNAARLKIQKLYFQIKKLQDSVPATAKDIAIALRFENVVNSSIIEYDFIDPVFIQTVLYRGNNRVKNHTSPIYRKIALEVIGLDQVLRQLEKTAPKKSDLSVSLLLKIHKILFEGSWPDIAGRFRSIDVRIRGLKQRPAHPSQISGLVYQHLGWIDGLMKLLGPVTESNFFEIFHVAADLQCRIIETYPFRTGNWRIARAFGNYVLQNSGMFPNIIDFEKRKEYLDAVSDSSMNNLKPLENFLLERYYETIIKIKGFLEIIKKESE
jgi:fido (protein-threonine AMPylation protein)